MTSILRATDTIYFETKCVLAVKDTAAAPPALLKVQKFCSESSLKPYVIQMMDEHNTCALLLTKQNLTAKTAYYCSSAHLSARRFASLEALMGNNVKRLLSKSDSKFFSRFSSLLQPGLNYTKQINANSAVIFSKSGANGVKMSRLETDQRWKFESNAQCYVVKSEAGDLVTLDSCKISPPNLMMNLWDAPEVARRYILADIASGATEDRDCKEGSLVSAPSKNSIFLPGAGHIELEAEEPSTCAKSADDDTDDSCYVDAPAEDCTLDYALASIKQTMDIINSTGPKLQTASPSWLAVYLEHKERRGPAGSYRLF